MGRTKREVNSCLPVRWKSRIILGKKCWHWTKVGEKIGQFLNELEDQDIF